MDSINIIDDALFVSVNGECIYWEPCLGRAIFEGMDGRGGEKVRELATQAAAHTDNISYKFISRERLFYLYLLSFGTGSADGGTLAEAEAGEASRRHITMPISV